MKTLSRNEMKNVIGGTPPGDASCGCVADSDCGFNHYCSSSQVITCDDKTIGKACVRN